MKYIFLCCIVYALISCIEGNSKVPTIIEKDYTQEDVITFVEEFYSFLAADTIHDRFIFPDIKKRNGLYYLDLQEYIDKLEESQFFSLNYIKSDSILLAKCIQCFDSKKYTLDLEGSFLDECQVCYDTDFNRLTGTEDYVKKFQYKTVIKTGKKYCIIGNCITQGGLKGDELKITILIDSNDKLKFDEIKRIVKY